MEEEQNDDGDDFPFVVRRKTTHRMFAVHLFKILSEFGVNYQ